MLTYEHHVKSGKLMLLLMNF